MRIRAAATALTLAATLTTAAGCTASRDNANVTCVPGSDHIVALAAHMERPDPRRLLIVPIGIVVQAISVAPGYRGVKYVGVVGMGSGISGTNPLELDETTSWDGEMCWPLEMPVALLFRAWVRDASGLQVGDQLHCFIEANAAPEDDFLDHQHVDADLASLIPGHETGILTQCVYYYTPAGWTGDPLPTFPPLG